MKGLFREPLQNAPVPDGGSPSFRLFRDNAAHNRRARGAAGVLARGCPPGDVWRLTPGPVGVPAAAPAPRSVSAGATAAAGEPQLQWNRSDGGGRGVGATVGSPKVGENPPDDDGVLDCGDHAACGRHSGTGQYVHREGVPHQLRPRPLPRRLTSAGALGRSRTGGAVRPPRPGPQGTRDRRADRALRRRDADGHRDLSPPRGPAPSTTYS